MAARGACAAAGDADTSHRGTASRIRRRLRQFPILDWCVSAGLGDYQVGSLAATCGSTRAGPEPMPMRSAAMLTELAALAPDVILAHGNVSRGSIAAGDANCTNRVSGLRRSRGHRTGRKPRAAGRQRDRYQFFRPTRLSRSDWACCGNFRTPLALPCWLIPAAQKRPKPPPSRKREVAPALGVQDPSTQRPHRVARSSARLHRRWQGNGRTLCCGRRSLLFI